MGGEKGKKGAGIRIRVPAWRIQRTGRVGRGGRGPKIFPRRGYGERMFVRGAATRGGDVKGKQEKKALRTAKGFRRIKVLGRTAKGLRKIEKNGHNRVV